MCGSSPSSVSIVVGVVTVVVLVVLVMVVLLVVGNAVKEMYNNPHKTFFHNTIKAVHGREEEP